ncbi:MAG: hypothetical protein AB1689_04910 [Thermodesulfobacteriota bacterium]
MLNSDFAEMLSALSDAGADFLVVGAYALAAHGVPRATGDLDIWVRPTRRNAARVLRALRSFGAPLFDLTADDLSREGTMLQIGQPPSRIDILTSIDGVAFREAWQTRLRCELEGVVLAVLGRDALIRNKRAVARPKDLLDIAILEQAAARRGKKARVERVARRPGRR